MRFRTLQFLLVLLLTSSIHAQSPTSANVYAEQAIARFEKNDFNGAITDFTKAIELGSANLEFCFYFRGMSFYRLGKLDEALSDLSKAISLKEHARFYDDRGNMLAQKGDFATALSDLNRAIQISPTFAKAYGDRGLVRLMLGEDSAAESDFKKCFELDAQLKPQFEAAVAEIRHRAAIYAEHRQPTDIEVLKFSWSESPSTTFIARQSATISMPSKPLSQTGTRVLGDPTAKDQAGPPPLLDPSSTSSPNTPSSASTIQHLVYRFSASLKNGGSKTIIAVRWAYVFYSKEGLDPLVYVFSTKINIRPSKVKTLNEQMPAVTPKNIKVPTEYSRSQFDERFVILRLNYSDGSSWQSTGVTETQNNR